MPKKKNPNRPARPAAPRVRPQLPDGPVRIGAKAPEVEVEMEALFVLEDQPVIGEDGYQEVDEDGTPRVEDVTYSIPKDVPPNLAMRYLRDVRAGGDQYAVAEAFALLLGEHTLDALAEAEGMTDENMQQVMDIVEVKMTSATSKALGNS